MIRVEFDPDALEGLERQWWERWSERARIATDKIIETWERKGAVGRDDFQSSVWSDLKAWLLDHAFEGKCAYCETVIREARQPGHAEHFRPKGGIRNRREGRDRLEPAATTNVDGLKIEHPGYFWLAYHWRNLLPSCNDCNTGQGKNSQFPAKRHLMVVHLSARDLRSLKDDPLESPASPGWYYLGPRDLDARENRQLLHPCLDDPRRHIRFGHRGIEAAIEIDGKPSPLGLHSIAVYELDGDGLRRARQQAQVNGWARFQAAHNNALMAGRSPQDARVEAEKAVEESLRDSPGYSAAVEDFVELVRRNM